MRKYYNFKQNLVAGRSRKLKIKGSDFNNGGII